MRSATNISRGSVSRITRQAAPAATRADLSIAMTHFARGHWWDIRLVLTTKIASAALFMMACVHPSAAAPVQTYLALGDSIAFGETDVIPLSFGDQGYVKPFADFLATQNGGARPNVINLAFPGETSSSFFTAIPPVGFAPHSA